MPLGPALVLLLAVTATATAHAEDRGPVYRPEKIGHDEEAGGDHWRFETWNGPVHVWRPRGYAEKTAGVVVYVHGLYITVDGAWKNHRLAEQFAASGLNALFIAPEAPAGGGDPVLWPGLGTLILEVEKHLEVRMPRGPLVVMGHSGAYRTLVTWLDYKPLDRVILLDALYDNEPEFQAWLQARGRQLTLVEGKSTRERSQRFVKGLRRLATAMPSIPDEAARFTRRQRRARLLHVKSQYGHFELVTEGKAIPVLLGATGLPRL